MNRIMNFKVLPAMAAAAMFFVLACSSLSQNVVDPENKGQAGLSSSIPGAASSPSVQGQISSSSGQGQVLPSSGQQQEQSSSEQEPEYSVGSQGGNQTLSSSQNATQTNSSGSGQALSSSVRASSSGTQNASSSSRLSSSSSRSSSSSAQNASSSSKPSSSSVNATPQPNPTGKTDYSEKVGSVSFDMIYIPGGTFTIGCEASSGCPSDTKAVSGVKVSNYFISKTEVTNGLWKAVMGSDIPPPSYAQSSGSATHITWYDAMEFACKLSNLTGKNYRMTTEAEWEYAAKNHKSSLSGIGGGSGVGGEEWAYNSWSSTHSGGTDPVGPGSGLHTQKTRRDANTGGDNVVARLIRSIEGIGPALRLAVSADVSFPPDYVSPCNLHAPKLDGEPTNSYRDPRWVTGSNSMWTKPTEGTVAIGEFDLRAWEDGTARLCTGWNKACTNGQWFTSNNITFVFVPSSGTASRYAYIFVDEKTGSLITEKSYMNGGFIGRIQKIEAANYDKPSVTVKSGEELAKAQSDFNKYYKMVNMENIPESAKEQDPRLLDEDTPNAKKKGWFQNNTSAGGVHHYRKDVDPDEFRFTVNQNNGRTMLANGKWFTINNTFLRVVHSGGYTADYLYSVDADGTFYHNSFMGYERGDFRMFKKETNGDAWPKTTCGNICSEEIPTGLSASMYSSQGATGKSTFVPAPCPTGGCK